jgi:sec-independent protein translocase protein TatC
MASPNAIPEGTMSLLEHLDELRSRLFRCGVVFVLVLAACWFFRKPILQFLVKPIEGHLAEGEKLAFIHMTEPFMIFIKASAIVALFLSAPYLLYQLWAFVAPGLYRRERSMFIPFLFFGTLFFVGGGAFGYYVATPVAAKWLIGLGEGFEATITLRSAFQFLSRVIIGMGAVFELPILIFFLSRIGVVTPGFLMRHFRTAVLLIAVLAAIITPTGLLGVLVAWVFGKPGPKDK